MSLGVYQRVIGLIKGQVGIEVDEPTFLALYFYEVNIGRIPSMLLINIRASPQNIFGSTPGCQSFVHERPHGLAALFANR